MPELSRPAHVMLVFVLPDYRSFVTGAEFDDSVLEFIESLGGISGIDH
jgi:hypothetical protein